MKNNCTEKNNPYNKKFKEFYPIDNMQFMEKYKLHLYGATLNQTTGPN